MSDLLSFLFDLAAAVTLHELGHLVAAKLLGIPCRRAGLRLLGGQLTFDFSQTGYFREALVHLAGPLIGIVTALTALCYNAVQFAGISLALSLINLLPFEGFDGGGILRCFLAPRLPPDTAYRIAHLVSWAARIFFWVCAAQIVLRSSADLGLILFATGLVLTEK